jgi:hypothetical protein
MDLISWGLVEIKLVRIGLKIAKNTYLSLPSKKIGTNKRDTFQPKNSPQVQESSIIQRKIVNTATT